MGLHIIHSIFISIQFGHDNMQNHGHDYVYGGEVVRIEAF